MLLENIFENVYKEIATKNFNSNIEVIKFLLDHGFKKLSNEHNAAMVFSLDEKFVVKVGKLNDGWLTFAEAIKDKHNVHFPKIFLLKRFKTFYISIIEKLQELSKEEYEYFGADTPDINAFYYNTFRKYSSDKEYLEEFLYNFIDTLGYEDIPKNIEALVEEYSDKFIEKYPSLSKAVEEIISWNLPGNFDLYYDNFMKRDTTVVITDPLA